MPGQVIGQARADAQDTDQPFPEPRFGAQRGPDLGHVRRGVRVCFAVSSDDPGQPEQGQVGIGRRRDRLQHCLVLGRAAEAGDGAGPLTGADIEGEIGGHEAFRLARVAEPHPGEPPRQGCRPRAAHPGTHAMTVIRMPAFHDGSPGDTAADKRSVIVFPLTWRAEPGI